MDEEIDVLHVESATLNSSQEWDGRSVEIFYGQRIKVLDSICPKTGLREDNGSIAFGDWGMDEKVRLIGGEHDGFYGWLRNDGITSRDGCSR